MSQTFYQVDAFSKQAYAGNPAAVMVLPEALSERQMQAIAAEMNLSETAFVVASTNQHADFDIRWFTPSTEIPLCGHATLASAHVLFRHEAFPRNRIRFHSSSGILLTEQREDGKLELDFPAQSPEPIDLPVGLEHALGAEAQHTLRSGRHLLAVFASSEQVAALKPEPTAICELPFNGVCCTAPGSGAYQNYDFVCRYFAPKMGIPEDPVTGSAYTVLVPYYAMMSGKTAFSAKQISARGGELDLQLRGERVKIAGDAVTVIKGEFYL